MDFKTRLKNKTFVVTMLAAVIAFIYQVLAICNVVPIITQDEVMQVVMLVVNVLVGLGVLIDPTTSGIADGKERSDE